MKMYCGLPNDPKSHWSHQVQNVFQKEHSSPKATDIDIVAEKVML